MNEIVTNALIGLTTLFTATIVPMLIKYLYTWMASKSSVVKIEKLNVALGTLEQLTVQAVRAANETFVKELKAKSKNGKLSKSDANQVLSSVLETVKQNAGKDILQALGKDGENLNKFIAEMIESDLAILKQP